MALQELTVPIPLAGGIDTKTDDKSVAPPMLLDLQNGVMARGGTIRKRTGYTALGDTTDDGGSISSGVALARRGAELVQFAGGRAYSYRDATGTWSDIGPAASTAATERTIAKTSNHQQSADAAALAGVMLVAWWDPGGAAFGGGGGGGGGTGGVWAAIVDATTRRVLRDPWQVDSGGTMPRVIAVSDRLHCYWSNQGAGQLRVIVINPTAYAAAAPIVVVANDLATADPSTFDAIGYGSVAFVAYARATDVRTCYVSAGGIVTSSPAAPGTIATAPQAGIAVDAQIGPGLVAVAFVDAGDQVWGVLYADTDITTPEASGVATVISSGGASRVACAVTSKGLLWVAAEGVTTLDRDSLVEFGSIDITGATTALGRVLGHGLAVGGWIDDGCAHFGLVHAVTFYPYGAVVRVDADGDVSVAARFAVGTSSGLPSHTSVARVTVDGRTWRFCAGYREQLIVAAGASSFTETSIRDLQIDAASAGAFASVEWGDDLIVAGSAPLRYDGRSMAELGFACAPDDIATPTVGAGGALTPSSSYAYLVSYEEVDAAGLIHPGPVSIAIRVDLGATDTRVSFVLPTYRLTRKPAVRIAVWRTEANDTTGDPIYYRVTSIDPSATAGDNRFVASDPTTDTVTFDDAMADTVMVATGDRCYASAGVLSNDPMPVGHVMMAAKGRLFFNDTTDAELVRFTQERRDGYGPELADLRIRVPGGDVTALAILDDAVLVFAADQVSAFGGPGPLPDPEAAPQIGFSAPRVLAGAGDIGSTAPRAIGATPDRVFFQASRDRGIYQIGRDQSVTYVGAPVEAYNAVAIRSAELLPGSTQVVFLSDDADGRALVFDYFFGVWSTWTNHRGADALVVGGVYHYLRANAAAGDARVFRADSSIFTDDGRDVSLVIATAWIKLAGYHQGWQSIWHASVIGRWRSSHLLRVRVATDYRPGWDAPIDIDPDANRVTAAYGAGPYGAGPYGGAADLLYQERIHVSEQCQAIRFEFSDLPPAAGGSLGASFELTELLLSGGVPKRTPTYSAGRTH